MQVSVAVLPDPPTHWLGAIRRRPPRPPDDPDVVGGPGGGVSAGMSGRDSARPRPGRCRDDELGCPETRDGSGHHGGRAAAEELDRPVSTSRWSARL